MRVLILYLIAGASIALPTMLLGYWAERPLQEGAPRKLSVVFAWILYMAAGALATATYIFLTRALA